MFLSETLFKIIGSLWILVLGLFSYCHSIPVVVEKPRSSFTLGPCTWIIDRQCPDDDVKFYLYTRQNLQDRQRIHIDDTWEKSNLSTSNFNPYHPVKIIIHGYNSDMFLHPLVQMKDEYLQRGDYNLLYVDWSNLSPGPCYISAVHNCDHVGACIAQLIERILESGTANIHLIGFSLGAQVTNFVARNLGSFVIPRISGLDPAMPLFITAPKEDKLDPSDAAFVDIIHTNALIQGKIERCGHVDFYMNGGILQPGCFNSNENPIACSHHRAPDYFAESIRSYKGFWGWGCSSYINYLLGFCPPTNFLVLAGEDCHPESKGMFMVTTSSQPPYALGKWTDLNTEKPETHPLLPFSKANPLKQEIDQWGKLEGSFNNIMHFPTPYSQDPVGEDWTYFGEQGPKQIIDRNSSQNDVNRTEYQNNVTKAIKKVTIMPLNISHVAEITVTKSQEELRRIFIEEYKKNLTLGLRNSENFKLPKLEKH